MTYALIALLAIFALIQTERAWFWRKRVREYEADRVMVGKMAEVEWPEELEG